MRGDYLVMFLGSLFALACVLRVVWAPTPECMIIQMGGGPLNLRQEVCEMHRDSSGIFVDVDTKDMHLVIQK